MCKNRLDIFKIIFVCVNLPKNIVLFISSFQINMLFISFAKAHCAFISPFIIILDIENHERRQCLATYSIDQGLSIVDLFYDQYTKSTRLPRTP